MKAGGRAEAREMESMSDDDDDLKRQIIAHDVRAMATRAARAGREVRELRDSAGRSIGVEIIGKPLTRKQKEAQWEEVLRALTAERVMPGLLNVLRASGKRSVLDVALRIHESRLDLRPAVLDALEQLGMTSQWQREELRYIDRVWKKILSRKLKIEHLAPMVSAARLKGPGVLETWVARIRQHRPDLMPALLEILCHG